MIHSPRQEWNNAIEDRSNYVSAILVHLNYADEEKSVEAPCTHRGNGMTGDITRILSEVGTKSKI
jgi:hypothetical protein